MVLVFHSCYTPVVSTLPISTSWDCSEILKHTREFCHLASMNNVEGNLFMTHGPLGVRVDHPCEKVRIIIQNSKQRSLDPKYHRLKLEGCFVLTAEGLNRILKKGRPRQQSNEKGRDVQKSPHRLIAICHMDL